MEACASLYKSEGSLVTAAIFFHVPGARFTESV